MSTNIVQLTELDKKILNHIRRKGLFVPKHELAKDLRISLSTLKYRLNFFEKNKIIVNYYIRFNHEKIGLPLIAIVFFELDQRQARISNVMQKMLKKKGISSACSLTGNYDLAIKIYAKNFDELSRLLFDLKSEFCSSIVKSKSYICAKVLKFHDLPFESEKRKSIDEKELKIMRFVKENPNASSIEISNELGYHRNTINKKWQNLLKEKVVWKKTPAITLDYLEDIDRGFTSFVFFDVKTGKAIDVAKNLIKFDEIHELYLLNDLSDIFAVVNTRSVFGYQDFVNKIYSEFSEDIIKTRANVIVGYNHSTNSIIDFVDL